MKILHIIPGLKKAGAEKNLFNLVTKDKKNTHLIISLSGFGHYGKILKNKNFKVYQINLKQNFQDFKKLYKLYKIIKLENPDIVQTWMYYADVIGGIISKFCGIKKVFWNLRSDGLNFKSEKLKIIPFYIIFNLFSFIIPTKIISNNHNGILKHENFLNKKKFIYIANGFVIPKIKKNKNKVFTIGHLGRYHPLKNHKMIFNIAEILYYNKINFKLFLGGKDVNKKNIFFKKNLKDKIFLLGQVKDTNKYYQGLDCFVSTSYSEGFPNVLAEAMSNGIICFATNAGMSKTILNDASRIFINEKNLLKKIIKLIKIKKNNYTHWLELKKNCRNHIINNFSVQKMITNYDKVWSNH